MAHRDHPHAAFLVSVADCFDLEAREEGTKIALRGDVHSLGGDATYAEGVVLDQTARRVWLGLRDRTFEASCDCPQRSRGVFCRHIWALIVRGVSKGYLGGMGAGVLPAMRSLVPARERPPVPWQEAVGAFRSEPPRSSAGSADPSEFLYYADPVEAERRGLLVIRVATRRRKKNGELGVPQIKGLTRFQVDRLQDPIDQRVMELFMGADGEVDSRAFIVRDSFLLSESLAEVLLPVLAQSGRFVLWDGRDKSHLPPPCSWEEGDPWTVRYSLDEDKNTKAYHLQGRFERGDERMSLADPELVLAPGILIRKGKIARFRADGDFRWIGYLRKRGIVRVPPQEIEPFLSALFSLRQPIPIRLPSSLRIKETDVDPQPRLQLSPGDGHLIGKVTFDYAGWIVEPKDPRELIFKSIAQGLVRRRREKERAELEHLKTLPWKGDPESALELDPGQLPAFVAELGPRGWRVEGEAGRYRSPGRIRMAVRSELDWFEMDGGVEFEGKLVPFPQLLKALRSGEGFVRLGNGSVGLLPEDWLRRHGLLLAAGERSGDRLHFRPQQALILDLLLAAEPEARVDAGVEELRRKWRSFGGVTPIDPPEGFKGELRPYQRGGLGWLRFLQENDLGGVLADDMGLGKTVQALAHLEFRRQAGKGQSLIVMPLSLLHNWKVEAARFTPRLRVLEHWGPERKRDVRSFDGFDLVLTTYGTLRADIAFLKDRPFDCVILDEAQSIKNARTATAKAARLLSGKQRLALSGTPIENHLGELWSLMEFLNPGLLGSGGHFRNALETRGNDSPEGRAIIARALRPFILRRTKDQVAAELPARTEQTVLVELSGAERTRYDELKSHYRKALLSGGKAWSAANFNVLEALLRLRQAACHPGLLDPARRTQPSSKLEALLVYLKEVVEEGRKALVFSQFTTFLGIVKSALGAEGISYSYLDGKTRDRAAAVEKFRTDPECRLFLISLKAGGLGLNLTEAEVVILLDPWWNPAVEAQAIDRTHRIGQTRPVFAVRLVSKDTVEEKVLELQRSKRDLADAILGGKSGGLGDLTREDLELLLA
ncbi:MAG TPA: DEAD/DEAH box helicase [Planctomycetota bacterium]|nr:DEAD/DEAH box helicase [Planctomycetota bacterium]